MQLLYENKRKSREISWRAISVKLARDDGDLDYRGGSEGKKQPSGYVLQVESSVFNDKLTWGEEKKN